MIKLIVSDMDGTLISEHMSISKENKTAIDYAQSKGVPFAIATGRHLNEALPVLQSSGISCPIITANGGAVYNTAGDLIDVFALSKEKTLELLRIVRRYDKDLLIELATVQTMVTDKPKKSLEMLAKFIRAHLPESTEEEVKTVLEKEKEYLTTQAVPSLEELVLKSDDRTVLKFFISQTTENNVLEQLKNDLREVNDIIITSSHPTNIEINSIHATKGQAVHALAQKMAIPMANVMALGDNFNDTSMIQMVGFGIAMGNAEKPIKQIAHHVTTSNIEHGVAKAIYDFIH